jgi:hypothetical protein
VCAYVSSFLQVNGGQLPQHVMPFGCIAFGILAAVLPLLEALAKYKHQKYQQRQEYSPLQNRIEITTTSSSSSSRRWEQSI